jgi:hypothetical protein
MGVWVSNKCYVVCFDFYITSWFYKKIAQATNIVHLLNDFDVFV